MTDAHAKAVEAAGRAARELAIPHTNKIEPWNEASTAERSVWLGHAKAAISAYLAAMRAEGWVVVPVEPTREMWAASANALVSDRNGAGSGAHHDHISGLVWTAMLKGAGDELVERVAEAVSVDQHARHHLRPVEWVDHTNMWRDECRARARAALAIIEPAVREECAVSCETLEWGKDISWWLHATKKDVAAESGHQCAAAIRAGAKP